VLIRILILFSFIFFIGNLVIKPVQASDLYKTCPNGEVCSKFYYVVDTTSYPYKYIHESSSRAEACSKWYPTGIAELTKNVPDITTISTGDDDAFGGRCAVRGDSKTYCQIKPVCRINSALTKSRYKIKSGGPSIDSNSTGEQACNIMTNHPVNIYSGNKFYQVSEFKGVGRNALHFQRFYNSLSGRWTVTYSRNIDLANKKFYTDSGKVLPIKGSLIKGYGLLEPEGRGSVIYTNDGAVEHYNQYGRLDTLITKNGKRQTFNYSGVIFIENKSEDEIDVFNKNNGKLIATLKYKYTSLASQRAGFWSQGTLITVNDEFDNQFKIVVAHDLNKPQLYLKDGFLGYPIAWQSSNGLSALFYYADNKKYKLPLAEVNYFDDLLISPTKKHIKNIIYQYDNLLLNGKISYITKVIENGNEISNVEYYRNGLVKRSSITYGIESSSFKYDTDKTTVTNSNGKQNIYTFKDGNVINVEGLASQNCLRSDAKYFNHIKYGQSGNGVKGSKRSDGTFSLIRTDELGRTVCILEGGGTPDQRYRTFIWSDKPSRLRYEKNSLYGIRYFYSGPSALLTKVKKFTVSPGSLNAEQYSICED